MSKIVGLKGEVEAQEYLKNKGYEIVATNYKNKIGEIDIICKKDGVLVFVEVKTRESLKFGHPREAVNYHKQIKIRNVAIGYLKYKNLYEKCPIRFDVIDIVGQNLTHIENAFWLINRHFLS